MMKGDVVPRRDFWVFLEKWIANVKEEREQSGSRGERRDHMHFFFLSFFILLLYVSTFERLDEMEGGDKGRLREA